MATGKIIAFVGMPGAGKSEAASYFREKGIPFVRFGDLTDETVAEMDLPLTPQNERIAREKLRKELGMAAYAIKAKPKIKALLKTSEIVALDGLYSWEEYVLLKEEFPQLLLIHIFAEPTTRYARLAKRKIRPVGPEESRDRDVLELEKLNKGGPIAIADFLISNNADDIQVLYNQLDALLARITIRL